MPLVLKLTRGPVRLCSTPVLAGIPQRLNLSPR